MAENPRKPRFTIGKKLVALNAVIWVGFAIILVIMFWSFSHIQRLMSSHISHDVDAVIRNAEIAREVSVIFSDTNLLLGTFRENDEILGRMGRRLRQVTQSLVEQAPDEELRASLTDIHKELGVLINQCLTVNMLLKRLRQTEEAMSHDLSRLDDIISRHIIGQVSRGVDASIMEQRSAMISAFREKVLEAAVLFENAEREHRYTVILENQHPVISAIDDLHLNLLTFTAPDPKAESLIIHLITSTQDYRVIMLRYYREMNDWSALVGSFDKAKADVLERMTTMNRAISRASSALQSDIAGIIYSSGVSALVLAGSILVALCAMTAYFLISSIKRPIEALSEGIQSFGHGDLAASIRLGREDEWCEVENALNSMASDLADSYSELQRRQAELKTAEEKYRGIFEHAVEGIYQANPNGRFMSANPALARILGYDSPEDLMEHVTDIATQVYADPGKRGEFLSRLRRDREVRGLVLELRRRDGMKLWAAIHTRGVFDENGDLALIEGILEDITERMRLEEELRQASKMQAIGQLAGGIAHDFNNLLTAMLGYCNMMMQQIPNNHPHFDKLVQISRAGERAAELTSQLLAFSRKQVLEMKVMDLNAVISDMGDMLQRLIGEDIRFTTVLDPAIRYVEADPGQVQQILMNLALNARDAMGEGGSLTIETANAVLDEQYARTHQEVEPGEYVMIAVSDTGLGMDSTTLSRVFDPFFTTKEKGSGTGLGLSTVYGIVRQHKGHVTAYSEPGRGTSFKVYLPATAARPQVEQPVPQAPSETRGKETILIVEDEKAVRELAGEALRLLGYTVLTAGNPIEAQEVAESHRARIDLLLTDVVLPNMDGRSLFNKLSESMPALKVLYMSGYTDNAIVHHGVLDSQVCFLQKPFTIGSLGGKVREALSRQSP